MDREKIIARVRKLYAMSQASDSSPHEAEIALRRCQSLMLKFGIKESELETSDYGKSSIGRRFRSVPAYVTLVSSAVAILHDCVCIDAGEIEFRGFSLDAEVAGLTYQYLIDSMERSLRLRKRAGELAPGRSASFDYRVGYGMSVLERCRAIHNERLQQEAESNAASTITGHALVIRKRALVEENCCADITRAKKKTVRYRPGKAHSVGLKDGKQVSLKSQLGKSDTASLN